MEEKTLIRTLVQLHVGEGLPFVHCYEPRIAFSTTTQIDNKSVLVIAESAGDGF